MDETHGAGRIETMVPQQFQERVPGCAGRGLRNSGRLNSGKRIDYIRSLCEVRINAWSQFMADPVLKPVELIPVFRDSFPRSSATGNFK